MTLAFVGLPVARADGLALASGLAAFADDALPPGALYAAVLHAPHAHARAERLDASHARALPGVAAVLLPEDAPELLRAESGFAGDRVAVAAAEDPELARRALEAIRLEWMELPAVLDPRPDAPLVFEAEAGGTAHAFATAERILETRLAVPPLLDTTPEPRACASWLGEDGRLNVRASCPAPFRLRRSLAARLAIPAGTIRVVGARTTHADPRVVAEDLCALLTLRTRRPVRLALRPRETRQLLRRSGAQSVTVRSGLREGGLVAIEVTGLAEIGAREPEVLAAWPAPLALYAIPSRRCVVRATRTHRPPAHGLGPAITLAVEAHLDAVAAELHEEPAELRRRLLSDAQARVMVAATRIGGLSRRRRTPVGSPRGVGLALAAAEATTPAGPATAMLRLNEDGSFHLGAGAGGPSGDSTALGQVAAEVLGVPPAAVHLAMPDTDASPASDDAPCFTAAALAVEAAARGLLPASRPPRSVPAWAEHARAALGGDRTRRLASVASAAAGPGPPTVAAASAEVELDPGTGVVRVLSLVVAVDCGQPVNPPLAEASVQGAACEVIGPLLGSDAAPASVDVPAITAVLVPGEGGAGPFGSRDMGGAPGAAAAAALLNAVARASGGRIEALPASPERVLGTLDDARSAATPSAD